MAAGHKESSHPEGLLVKTMSLQKCHPGTELHCKHVTPPHQSYTRALLLIAARHVLL